MRGLDAVEFLCHRESPPDPLSLVVLAAAIPKGLVLHTATDLIEVVVDGPGPWRRSTELATCPIAFAAVTAVWVR